jgi:SAM-dependent methyltransferase
MVAFTSLKREAIHRSVQQMYTAVARAPARSFHFPTGRAACEALGYPPALLAGVPNTAIESFAGVGCPFSADVIRRGTRVLDLGCGSGTDTLIAARLVGHEGKVYSLDMTAAMREKLRLAATEAGFDNLEVMEGDAEAIPLPAESVDVVTSNGVLNLVPDKSRAIAEIFRVLKPSGRLQLADIALGTPISTIYKQDPKLWAECVVGAVEEDRYLDMLRAAGFRDIQALGHFDYFGLSANAETRKVAGLFNAHALTLRATKPLGSTFAAASPARRAARSLAAELAGVGAVVLAWLLCAGAAPLVAALSVVGAAAIARHAYMLPAFTAFLALNVWMLWCSGYAKGRGAPFWLGCASAVFSVVTTWLAVTGIFPFMWWWAHVGVAGVVGASIWNFALARRGRTCLEDMIREAALRRRNSRRQRFARGAAIGAAAVALVYGLHKTAEFFVPEAEPPVAPAPQQR